MNLKIRKTTNLHIYMFSVWLFRVKSVDTDCLLNILIQIIMKKSMHLNKIVSQ